MSNKSERIKYQIVLEPTEGDKIIVQDYSSNDTIQMPEDFKGKIRIMAQVEGDEGNIQIGEFAY